MDKKKALLIIVTTIVIVVLIASLIFVPFEIGVIKEAYTYVSNEIVGVTGMSKYLVQGLVLLLLTPLLWIIPVLIKRKHKYNKLAWVSIIGYISLFFVSLFFFSQRIYFRHDNNKEALKWYAITPEGVKYYDTPGIDPIYGTKLRPVTPEVINRLKLLNNGDFKMIDPEKSRLFDPITGETQAWYYYSGKNGYEFYDKPGFHPMTGDPLLPVSKDVYEAWLKTKAEARAKEEAAKSEAKAKEQKSVAGNNVKNSNTKKHIGKHSAINRVIDQKDW